MASEREWGRDNAVNSKSSGHGRCREHARWIELATREAKLRNEGDRETLFGIWSSREDIDMII